MMPLLVLFFMLAAPPDTLTPAYRLYTGNGTPVALDSLFEAMASAEVVFLGERHNDPNAHALELLLLQHMAEEEASVALSLEMFERDVQLVLDEYLQGLIRERDFLRDSRPWRNYRTDYRPLVEYARERGLPVLAANAPARYVHLVAREGIGALERLHPEARAFLPPLPVPQASEAYRAKFAEEMRRMMPPPPDSVAQDTTQQRMRHGNPHIMDGQNLRDATMAYTLVLHLLRYPENRILQVNGAFHSEQGMGIPEHLRRYRPGTRMLILTVYPSEAYPAFDPERMQGIADFVFVTPEVED